MKPTREQVLQWMHQAANDYIEGWPENVIKDFETFAALAYSAGAAAEREKVLGICRIVAHEFVHSVSIEQTEKIINAIRALGDDDGKE